MNSKSPPADSGHLVLVQVRNFASNPTVAWRARVGFAGIVESVGENVSDLKRGEPVCGVAIHAFGNYVCVPRSHLTLMEAPLDFAAAARGVLD